MSFETATQLIMEMEQAKGRKKMEIFIQYCEHIRNTFDDIVKSFKMMQKLENQQIFQNSNKKEYEAP